MHTYATMLVLLLTVPVLAVQPYTPVHPDPMLESWRWRSYPELKGLGLRCMAEDRDGNMWFGVDAGVVRYDGVSWTTYTPEDGLLGAPVTTLSAAQDGSVYAGTDSGISRYVDGQWSRLFPESGDVTLRVRAIRVVSDGSVWAATQRGMLHLAAGRVTFFTDEGNAAWVQVTLPSADVTVVPDHAVPEYPWPERIHSGAQVADGAVWALLDGGPAEEAGLKLGDRIVTINGDSGKDWARVDSIRTAASVTVERVGVPEPFEVTVIPAEVKGIYREFSGRGRFDRGDVYEDQDGNIWFALRSGYVARYGVRGHPSAPAWHLYTAEDGLEIGRKSRIVQTRDGVIWVVKTNKPLNRFDGESWTSVRLSEYGGSAINTSIFESRDGTLWVGAHSGLYVYRDSIWQYFSYPEIPLPRTRIIDILQAQDGALWVAARGQEALRLDISDQRWMTLEGLNFACETRNRSLWFTSGDNGVVRYDPRLQRAGTGGRWMRYGVEDGLMDYPVALLATRDGGLWAAGSHDSTAATARFEGSKWILETHPKLAWSIHPKATFEAMDGSLWFGGASAVFTGGGLIQYDGATWHHHAGSMETGPQGLVYGIGQISEDALWAGSLGLSYYDGHAWAIIDDPPELKMQWSDAIYSGRDAGLWVGTRTYGAFHYDGQTWTNYGLAEGLADTKIRSLTSLSDGSVLAGTDKGISRFDGHTWTSQALHADVTPTSVGALRTSSDGALWINNQPRSRNAARSGVIPKTIRYLPETTAPETRLTLSSKVVSQPGNTSLAWEGADPWRATPDEEIQYAYRLDDADWSAFSPKTSHTFEALSSGDHVFDVKARDRDFNEDATPATASFTVVAPVWQQAWFVGMVIVFVSGIGFQTSRVIRRDRRLREGNEALSAANNELFQVNRDLESVNVDLQREQVLERLRGQAQGMQSSDDIGPVVEAVNRELRGLGLPLTSSGITIYLSETELERWYTAEDGRALEPIITGVTPESPVREARLRGDDYHHRYAEGEELKQWLRQQSAAEKSFETGGRWKGIAEERWPQRLDIHIIFFDGGEVRVESEEAIAEEYLMLMRRFGEVFGYAHQRWQELKQKEAQNRRLVVEASVQRLRAEVQSMDEASDFERILSLLTESLKTVELTFDGCEIDVLDEPVENPTMAHFEANGFRYTTFRLDPDGNVAPRSYNVAAPFPTVIEQTIERFIADEPWQGLSDEQRIVEVPAGSYGRLRLTASERDSFTEDEIATLREFADAVALGYARYLDIREIQEQTERKSAFLASMSHEFRTPMNAIKGFTNLVLRRGKDELSERNQENLQKVDQASDHLLAMINDLLDLSKIEAGRMDVNPERFDVGELVTSACDTVSPLVQEGVELRKDVADDIGEANTDKARLQQMVINLLSNAIKFTDSGSVTVSAIREPGTENRKTQGSTPDHGSRPTDDGSSVSDLVISVSDTGKGIPTEELPTIFDEYRQAEGSESRVQKGTGLGLSITRKFAELLGGSIRVESEVGKGSTFTITIPTTYET